jgi:hypothetical protein
LLLEADVSIELELIRLGEVGSIEVVMNHETNLKNCLDPFSCAEEESMF